MVTLLRLIFNIKMKHFGKKKNNRVKSSNNGQRFHLILRYCSDTKSKLPSSFIIPHHFEFITFFRCKVTTAILNNSDNKRIKISYRRKCVYIYKI